MAAALVIVQLTLTMASVALGAAAAAAAVAAIVAASFVVVVVLAAAAAQVFYYFPPANSVTFEFLYFAAVAYAVTVVAEFQTCLVYPLLNPPQLELLFPSHLFLLPRLLTRLLLLDCQYRHHLPLLDWILLSLLTFVAFAVVPVALDDALLDDELLPSGSVLFSFLAVQQLDLASCLSLHLPASPLASLLPVV